VRDRLRPLAWFCLATYLIVFAGAGPARGEAPSWLAAGEPTSFADSLRAQQAAATSGRSPAGLLFAGLGIFAGVGLAAYLKSEANGYYSEYLVTGDPELANDSFEKAQQYDRATLVGWVFAEVSFVALVYFLTRQGSNDLVPTEGEPLVRPSPGGMEVSFRW
jgi:hypothetical protein